MYPIAAQDARLHLQRVYVEAALGAAVSRVGQSEAGQRRGEPSADLDGTRLRDTGQVGGRCTAHPSAYQETNP